MASAKITITLPKEQLDTIRTLVAAGRIPSVSGFVQRAIAVSLDDVAGWQQTLSEALDATGGPVTEEERRWADRVLGSGSSVA